MYDEIFQLERTDSNTYRIVQQPISIVRGKYRYESIFEGSKYFIRSVTCPENRLLKENIFFLQGQNRYKDTQVVKLSIDEQKILRDWCNKCNYKFVCNNSYSLGALK